jgi:hypothetical protein
MEERISVHELPRGVWKWLANSARDLGRIAGALEKMAEELAHIRAVLEDEDKENASG